MQRHIAPNQRPRIKRINKKKPKIEINGERQNSKCRNKGRMAWIIRRETIADSCWRWGLLFHVLLWMSFELGTQPHVLIYREGKQEKCCQAETSLIKKRPMMQNDSYYTSFVAGKGSHAIRFHWPIPSNSKFFCTMNMHLSFENSRCWYIVLEYWLRFWFSFAFT